MAKIIQPASISTEFGITASTLEKHGVIDVLLNTDTLLFIDPLPVSYTHLTLPTICSV